MCLGETDRECSGKPQDTCESVELSKVQIVPGNDRDTRNEMQIASLSLGVGLAALPLIGVATSVDLQLSVGV